MKRKAICILLTSALTAAFLAGCGSSGNSSGSSASSANTAEAVETAETTKTEEAPAENSGTAQAEDNAVVLGTDDTSKLKAYDFDLSVLGDTPATKLDDAVKDGDFVVALSDSFSGNSWRQQFEKEFEAAAEKYKQEGYISDYVILDAGGDQTKQVSDIEDLTVANPQLPNHYKSVENIVALERFSTNEYTVVGMPNPDFMALYRSGDQRLTQYYKRATSSRYTLLKGGADELSSSFRSSEAYLTAAEAACRLGRHADAVQRLEPLLKHRLNAEAYDEAQALMATMTNDQLLQEILDERARELAFEGHRWYDLRRTTRPALQRQWDDQTYTLTPEHYTMRFPTEAVEANPEIEIWNN